jgi:hypothetical protein
MLQVRGMDLRTCCIKRRIEQSTGALHLPVRRQNGWGGLRWRSVVALSILLSLVDTPFTKTEESEESKRSTGRHGGKSNALWAFRGLRS